MAVSKISGRSVIPPVIETKRSSQTGSFASTAIEGKTFFQDQLRVRTLVAFVESSRPVSRHYLIFRSVVDPIPQSEFSSVASRGSPWCYCCGPLFAFHSFAMVLWEFSSL